MKLFNAATWFTLYINLQLDQANKQYIYTYDHATDRSMFDNKLMIVDRENVRNEKTNAVNVYAHKQSTSTSTSYSSVYTLYVWANAQFLFIYTAHARTHRMRHAEDE